MRAPLNEGEERIAFSMPVGMSGCFVGFGTWAPFNGHGSYNKVSSSGASHAEFEGLLKNDVPIAF